MPLYWGGGGAGFALSQHFPAGSATEVFKLFPKMSEGSSQVTAVWEMPQYSAPKAPPPNVLLSSVLQGRCIKFSEDLLPGDLLSETLGG